MGLIRLESAYVARYGEAFPEPTRVGAYDPNIDDNTTAVERVERNKTCSQRKTAYKRAHAKSRVKVQAKNGSVKFGAANSAARQDTANPPSTINYRRTAEISRPSKGTFTPLLPLQSTKRGYSSNWC